MTEAVPVTEAVPRRSFWRRQRRLLLGGGTIILFLLAWQAVAQSGLVKPVFLSSPVAVARAFGQLAAGGELAGDLVTSAREFAIGFGLAIGVGIPLGALIGWLVPVNEALEPLISAMYATPRVALVPLVIIWFGIGLASKVVFILAVSVFPILVNTASGFRNVDHQLVEVSHSFGGRSSQIFRYVGLPAAVPSILTGLRLGIGQGLVGIAIGEAFGATSGIGFRIFISGTVFRTDQLFVGLIILALSGVVLTELLRKLEERFDIWRPQTK